MQKNFAWIFGWWLVFSVQQCSQPSLAGCPSGKVAKMRGLNLVAPPQPFETDPMRAVQAIQSDWVAVIPFAFTPPNGTPVVRYNSDWQWWGERTEGVVRTIELAHEAGLRVMLKPQVYIPGAWLGDWSFERAEDWAAWEEDYEAYILEMAALADSMGVELFCFSTECKRPIAERPEFWKGLLGKVRAVYGGEVTYAANWDNYQNIPFWADLDYIGIDAYFPLDGAKTPTVAGLQRAWQPIVEALEAFRCRYEKPILFTEFGYLSVDGCAFKNWELEGKIAEVAVNELAQARAFEAVFATFWEKDWWAGGFIWKWFPENKGHEGYFEKDYTPQGKQAEQIIKNWFGRSN